MAEVTPAQGRAGRSSPRYLRSRQEPAEDEESIAQQSIKNVSALLKKFTGKDIKNMDVHIQFIGTYGAEGDSASISIATAVISAIESIPVRQDIAMTGSLSVRGDVLPIGGVTYKIEAAAKAGIKTVLIPRMNVGDVLIEERYKPLVTIIPVDTIDDVLKYALVPENSEGFLTKLKKMAMRSTVTDPRRHGNQPDNGLNTMPGVKYYDLRHVTGQVTHIDIDNGVVESAGTSFFNKAVLRVLDGNRLGCHPDRQLYPLHRQEVRGTDRSRRKDWQESPKRLWSLAMYPWHPSGSPHERRPRDRSVSRRSPRCLPVSKRLPGTRWSPTGGRIISSGSNRYGSRTVRPMNSAYEMCRSGFNVMAVASRNGNVQMGYEREHTIHGFDLRHRQESGKKAADIAVALLDAGAVKGGKMHAVLDPELAGVFAHEAVGHASEGDLIQEGNSVLKGRTGEKIGNEILTIVDDPALREFGFDPVDAEGTAVQRTEIIRTGSCQRVPPQPRIAGSGRERYCRPCPRHARGTPAGADEQHLHRER